MSQANQMVEYLLNNIDVPGGEFAIKTEEGFELVAFIGDSINFENNFDNFTEDERIIKHSFDLTVPGYLLNNKIPGQAPQIRSFFSAPTIDFSYFDTGSPVTIDYQRETQKEKVSRHVLTDVTNIKENELIRGDTSETTELFVANPFSKDGKTEMLKVRNQNARTGETVVSGKIIKEIDRQFE